MFKIEKINSFSRILFTAILFLIPVLSFAAKKANNQLKWTVEVKGTVNEKGKLLRGSVISLYVDSTLKQQITSDSGEFDFILMPDTDYMLTFTKPGYITKCMSFSTKDVPTERAKQGFSAFDVIISIYPKTEGIDVDPMSKAPLDMIRYSPDADDFAIDEKYTKSIAPFISILDYEGKQAVKRAQEEKTVALENEQLKRQRLIIYASIAILILVLAFALYAYRSYIQKKKINKELDLKNRHIEEKNREITDSINYARRIQHAIMPEHTQIKKVLPDSFILFKPKDIVSGDFYFYHKDKDKTFIAAADCTGHGVPGAFMSLIGYEKLHDAVSQTKHPGELLSIVNLGIREALRQSSDPNSTRDGMDIALCSIENKNGGAVVSYAGANRPLWINKKGSGELEEVKATKKAIGGFTEADQKFDAHEIHISKGDTFYLFSDGYADQFGGANGKKLTTKRFRELLLEIKEFSMEKQAERLEQFIEKWREKEEQLDDILVIGIRV